MTLRKHCILTFLLMGLLAIHAPGARGDVFEGFDDDPVSGGRAVVTGANASLDTAGAAAVPFTVTTPGTLTHNLCTNWRVDGGGVPDVSQFIADGSRLEIPLGQTYTQDDSFSFGATLKINRSGFHWSGAFIQMAFGLVNTATTGMDRTSSLTTAGDTYDGVEWDFFPDNTGVSTTVQQVVTGTQNGATSLFDRFVANFGSTLPVGAPPFDYGLPLDTWMDVTLVYDAATRTVSVSVVDSGNSTPYVDLTSVPDLVLPATWFSDSSAAVFAVDTLAVANYQDAWAFGSPSLVANVSYDNIWFTETAVATVPEPASWALAALGVLGLSRRRRHA